MVNQHESPFYDADALACQRAHKRIVESFPLAKVYQAHIPHVSIRPLAVRLCLQEVPSPAGSGRGAVECPGDPLLVLHHDPAQGRVLHSCLCRGALLKHVEIRRRTFLWGVTAPLAEAKTVLFGAPFDSTTSNRPGARFGPRRPAAGVLRPGIIQPLSGPGPLRHRRAGHR